MVMALESGLCRPLCRESKWRDQDGRCAWREASFVAHSMLGSNGGGGRLQAAEQELVVCV